MKVEKMVAVLVLALAGSTFAAEKVTLKNSYRPGTQVLSYSFEQDTSISGTDQKHRDVSRQSDGDSH